MNLDSNFILNQLAKKSSMQFKGDNSFSLLNVVPAGKQRPILPATKLESKTTTDLKLSPPVKSPSYLHDNLLQKINEKLSKFDVEVYNLSQLPYALDAIYEKFKEAKLEYIVEAEFVNVKQDE